MEDDFLRPENRGRSPISAGWLCAVTARQKSGNSRAGRPEFLEHFQKLPSSAPNFDLRITTIETAIASGGNEECQQFSGVNDDHVVPS
jgi:hypothetical protein